MICKECGAYNPDHATYCKVCAAKLKEDVPEAKAQDAVDDSRPTRSFVRPSWTVPASAKAEEKEPEEIESVPEDEELSEEAFEEVRDPEEHAPIGSIPKTRETIVVPSELTEELDDEPEEEPDEEPEADEPEPEEEPVKEQPRNVRKAPKKAKPAPKEEDEEDDEEEDDEEYVPVYHRPKAKRVPARQLTEEDDEEDTDSDEEDDSYEYEPTPPKPKKKNKGNGPLFWILLVSIIVVILCIIAAGVLMLMQSNGKMLSCEGLTPAASSNTKTPEQSAPNKTQTNEPSANVGEPEQTNPYAVQSEETQNEYGEDCMTFHIIAPAHAVMTLVLPSQQEYKFTNDKDVTVEIRLPVQKYLFYPNTVLTESEYVVRPELYLTETDGKTTQLEVEPFTLSFPSLTIDLEKPIADAEGKIMADSKNIVALTGRVDDFDVHVYINDEPVTVYAGGLFMYDYTMQSDASETITIRAEKENYVTTEKELTVDPYVFVPDQMELLVTNNKTTELKADKNGKVTVRGTTLPDATLTATSDNASVVCGSVSVDGEGNFLFNVTMNNNFYGVSTITIHAEKENAESGDTTCMVYRTYADRKAFTNSYSKAKKYKEVGSSFGLPELIANMSAYTGEYGIRITATIAEVLQGEDGYTYVRLTLAGTGETVYVMDLMDGWKPESFVGTKFNLYGNLVGTYGESQSPLFAMYYFVKKK